MSGGACIVDGQGRVSVRGAGRRQAARAATHGRACVGVMKALAEQGHWLDGAVDGMVGVRVWGQASTRARTQASNKQVDCFAIEQLQMSESRHFTCRTPRAA